MKLIQASVVVVVAMFAFVPSSVDSFLHAPRKRHTTRAMTLFDETRDVKNSGNWKNGADIISTPSETAGFKGSDRNPNTMEKKESLASKTVPELLELLKARNTYEQSLDYLGPEGSRALKNGKLFVEKLMTTELESISGSGGMRVMKDMYDLKTGQHLNLIIRTITEPFWQSCIEAVETYHELTRAGATGTFGTGKSTTTSLVIRMLLERGKTVVYHLREVGKDGWVYQFTPVFQNRKATLAVDGFEIKTEVFPERYVSMNLIASLWDPSTFYVVDAGGTKASCNPTLPIRAKVIIVASPEEEHWGGSWAELNRNNRQVALRFYPLWALDELLTARPFLSAEISDEVIRGRFNFVGGIPPRIFASNDDYAILKNALDHAVELLSARQAELIFGKQYIVIDTNLSAQTMSFVMGYVNDEDHPFSEEKFVVTSPAAQAKVFIKHMKTVWQTMQDYEVKGRPAGYAKLKLCASHLIRRGVYLPYRMAGDALPNESAENWPSIPPKFFGNCAAIDIVSDPVEAVKAAKAQPGILFASGNEDFSVTDFIYQDKTGHFHAFHTTASCTLAESASMKGIKNLVRKIGAKNLSIYYLMPQDVYETFSAIPAKPSYKGRPKSWPSIYFVLIPSPYELFADPDPNLHNGLFAIFGKLRGKN